jgi:very-short-patch-repair endonuclease
MARMEAAALDTPTLDTWRARLVDLAPHRNPMLHTPHGSARTRRYVRVIDEVPDTMFARLRGGQGFDLIPLPEPPDDTPPEEQTQDFLDALAQAREGDADYAACLEALEDREDGEVSARRAECEAALRARVRARLGLPPREEPKILSNTQIAQSAGLLPPGRVLTPYDLPERTAGLRHEDDRLQTLLLPDELRVKARGLKGYIDGDRQERGVDTLYAAFGFLEYWVDGRATPYFAPLVLLPLGEIKARNREGQEAWRVTPSGEGATTNTDLQAKIARDFGLHLPDLGDDDTPESYMARVARVIEPKARGARPWRVRRQATIGRFFLLAQVIDRAWPDPPPPDSALADLLRAAPESERAQDILYPLDDPGHEAVAGAPLTLVLPADASQESAILRALHTGRSLVVEGPPGTGKSQTITNLISSALGLGKRVLFMAEKRAALEVVHRKLQAAGLGPACLELHDYKATKNAVRRTLKGMLEARAANDPAPDPTRDRDKAAAARRALRAHSDMLHARAGGRNAPYDVGWTWVAHKKTLDGLPTAIRTFGGVPTDMTGQALEDTCADLAELEHAARADAAHGAGPAHPWHGARVADAGGLAVEDALDAVRGLAEALERYHTAVPDMAAHGPVGWGAPATRGGWDAVAAGAQALEDMGQRNADWGAVAALGPAPRPEVEEGPEGRAVLEAVFGPGAGPGRGRWAAAQRILEALANEAPGALDATLAAAPWLTQDGAMRRLEALRAEHTALEAQEASADTGSLAPARAIDDAATLDARHAAQTLGGAHALWFLDDPHWAARAVYWRLAEGPRPPIWARLRLPPSTMARALGALAARAAQWQAHRARVREALSDADMEGAEAAARWAGRVRVALAPLTAADAHAAGQRILGPDGATARAALRAGGLGLEAHMRARAVAQAVDALALPPALDEAARRGKGDDVAQALRAAHDAAAAHLARVDAALEAARDRAGLADTLTGGPLTALGAWAQRAVDAEPALRCRAARHAARAKAGMGPAGPLLAALEREVDGAPYRNAAQVFRALHHRSTWRAACAASPGLDGPAPAEDRADFRAADAAMLGANGTALAARLIRETQPPDGRSHGLVNDLTDMALVRHFAEKSMRQMTVRALMRRAHAALQALAPCVLMSPFSAAQYLGGSGARFDLLIIDEASQMFPWYAVPALARAGQVVIVGDPHQSPPSEFFRTRQDSQDEGDGEKTDESILAHALGALGARQRLCVHYRSRHPSLIQFSNTRLYNGTLTLFPAPDDRQAVFYEYVQGATYNEHVNEAEAARIVQAVQAFARDARNAKRSLMIITMNEAQMRLIRRKAEAMFRDDNAARAWCEGLDNGPEPFAVKTLDTVQGDERAVVYISTLYGPRSAGERVAQRFGPLITDAFGHRRLNVLITRAREEVRLFTSLTAADVTGESKNLGPRMLREYLEYAAGGGKGDPGSGHGGVESPFEAYVKAELEALGWEAVPQVGVANYRIDLGVRHPDWPHGFLLGVECDGATYHNNPSARDRDAIRQGVLEDLGWAIHRIWSTDWWRDAAREMATLHARARAELARKQAQGPMAPEPLTAPPSRAAQMALLLNAPDRDENEEPEPCPPPDEGISRAGDTVVYTFDDEPEVQHTATIVDGPNRPDIGHLIASTALARALLDCCAGDVFEMERPVGTPRRGRVLEIRHA